MLNEMLTFTTGVINAVSKVLIEPPFIYIVSFILAALTVKVLKTLLS